MTFSWAGVGGQPTYYWGGDSGSTGANHYVYLTSALNVNSASYATSAGNATTTSQTSWSSLSTTTLLTSTGGQSGGTLLTGTGSLGGISVTGGGGANAAFINFLRPSVYGVYLGLDTDNNLAVGGWSAGAALASMKVGSFGVGTAASGTAGQILATNDITAYYSDARLKTISGPILNALDKVNALSGVYYKSNEIAEKYGYTDQSVQVGVIAQEVKEVLPQVIRRAPFDMGPNDTSKSGEDYMTVQYEKLVPLLIEAIKELSAEVAELKSKI